MRKTPPLNGQPGAGVVGKYKAPLSRVVAVLKDARRHELLALVDALRLGRPRERQVAAQLLEAAITTSVNSSHVNLIAQPVPPHSRGSRPGTITRASSIRRWRHDEYVQYDQYAATRAPREGRCRLHYRSCSSLSVLCPEGSTAGVGGS